MSLTSREFEIALVLPAASVAVAVKIWVPLANAPVVKLQMPLAVAIAVPRATCPSKTVTVVAAVADPLRVTVLFELMVSCAMTGAAGGVVSICSVPVGFKVPGKKAALPELSLMVAPLRFTVVTVRSVVFWPALTV